MVCDDDIKNLLRWTRLHEDDLFGESKYPEKTLAALAIGPLDLAEGHKKARAEIGDGMFILMFSTPDRAADHLPISWFTKDTSSSSVRFPLEGDVRFKIPYINLDMAKRMGCGVTRKSRRTHTMILFFFLMGDDEGHFRTRPFYMVAPSDLPIRFSPKRMTEREAARFHQEKISEWISLKSSKRQGLDHMLEGLGIIDLGFNHDEIEDLKRCLGADIERGRASSPVREAEIAWGLGGCLKNRSMRVSRNK